MIGHKSFVDVTSDSDYRGMISRMPTYADASSFKLYMSDMGLLRKLAKILSQVVFDSSVIYTEFKGAMTENFVLNELVKTVYDETYC